jgi:hypothetical protein
MGSARHHLGHDDDVEIHVQPKGLVVVREHQVDQRAAEHHRRGRDPHPVHDALGVEAVGRLCAPVGGAVLRVDLRHACRIDGREAAVPIGPAAVPAEPIHTTGNQRALAVDQARVAGGEAHGVGLVEMGGEVALQEVFAPQIVRIEEADEWCLRLHQPGSCRAGLADILLQPHQPEALIVELIERALDHGRRIVGRRIVDDHALELAERLTRDRSDRIVDIVTAIVAGDDDRDFRKPGFAHVLAGPRKSKSTP